MSRVYFGQDVRNLKQLENIQDNHRNFMREKDTKREKILKPYQPNLCYDKKYDDNQSLSTNQSIQLWDINSKQIFSKYYQDDEVDNVLQSGKLSIQKQKNIFEQKIKPGSTNIIQQTQIEDENMGVEKNAKQNNKKQNNEIKKLLRLKVKDFYNKLDQENKDEGKQQLNDDHEDENVVEGKEDDDINSQPENKQPDNLQIKQAITKKVNLLKTKANFQNYVKADLNKKWGEKYRGQIYVNKKFYTKNGRQKNKFQARVNEAKNLGDQRCDFQVSSGQVKLNNIYMQSISKALMIDLYYEGQTEADIFLEEQGLENIRQQLIDQQTQLYSQPETDKLDEILLQLLQKIFNHREGQIDAIKSIYSGRSLLMVQKTGFGKSLIYQLLSLLWKDGIAIIFSPLISLMIDQIQKLPNIIPAVAYHSLLTSFQKIKLINLIKDNKVRLLFCTPEVFQNDLAFMISSMGRINFIVIDEAHCVSELSQNFRPTYIVIDQLIKHFIQPIQPPYLALTATATVQTIESICIKFSVQDKIINSSTARNNLVITVSRDREVNQGLIIFLSKHKNLKSVIIYARSRYMVESISNYLQSSGINAKPIHAGMDDQQRLRIQNDFMQNNVNIIVATSVFAMGIDKPDIRCVIHINLPKSMESYIQEIGRAGRDGQIAYCHLFLNENDYHIERGFIIADFPDKNTVKDILKLMRTRKKAKKSIDKYVDDMNKQQSQQGQIYSINVKESQISLDLNKDSIFTIMRVLEAVSNDYNANMQKQLLIKIYPICHERIVLRFFKFSKEEICSQSSFVNELNQIAKCRNGELIVPVIKCCNMMTISPMELFRRCKELYAQFMVTCEMQEEIISFQFDDGDDLGDDNDEGEFQENFLLRVYMQLELYKTSSLNKLNYMYLSMNENSFFNVEQMIQAKDQQKERLQIVQNNQQIFYDLYFNSKQSLNDLKEYLYGKSNEIINIDEMLPFDQLDEEQISRIQVNYLNYFKFTIVFFLYQNLINRFFREETAHKTTAKERYDKIKVFLKDPKILAKILCGINSINYSYTEWKNNNIWGVCKRFKYEEIYNVLIDLLANRLIVQQEQQPSQKQL